MNIVHSRITENDGQPLTAMGPEMVYIYVMYDVYYVSYVNHSTSILPSVHLLLTSLHIYYLSTCVIKLSVSLYMYYAASTSVIRGVFKTRKPHQAETLKVMSLHSRYMCY